MCEVKKVCLRIAWNGQGHATTADHAYVCAGALACHVRNAQWMTCHSRLLASCAFVKAGAQATKRCTMQRPVPPGLGFWLPRPARAHTLHVHKQTVTAHVLLMTLCQKASPQRNTCARSFREAACLNMGRCIFKPATSPA